MRQKQWLCEQKKSEPTITEKNLALLFYEKFKVSLQKTVDFKINPGAPPCTKNCANPIPGRFPLFDLDDNNLRKPCKSLIFSALSDESVEMVEK